jgi:hypothetical protein
MYGTSTLPESILLPYCHGLVGGEPHHDILRHFGKYFPGSTATPLLPICPADKE